MPSLTLADLEKKWLQEQYAPGLSKNLPVALVRENLALNPVAGVSIAGWSTGGAQVTVTRETATPPTGFTSYVRFTHDASTTEIYPATAQMPMVPNNTYSAGVWLRCSTAKSLSLVIKYATIDVQTVTKVLVANTWTYFKFSAVAQAGATQAYIYFVANVASETVDMTGLIFTAGSDSTYFDGDTVDTYNTDYSWTGTAHASTSKSTLTSARENLVKNPSAEVDTAQWTNYGTLPGISRSTIRFVKGLASFRIAPTGSGTQGMDTQIPNIKPSTVYTISVQVFREAGAAAGAVTVEWRTSEGAFISAPAIGPFPAGTGVWTTLSLSVTSPANAGKIHLDINYSAAVANVDIAYIDAVLLNEGTNSNYFDGDTTDFYNVDHTWTGTPHASTSKLTTSPMGITLRENLIKNPSFETDLLKWFMSAGTGGVAALTRVAGGYVGGWFTRATWSTANTVLGAYIYTGLNADRLPVVAGKTYTFSGMVRSNIAQNIRIHLNYRDIADALLSTAVGATIVLVPNTWIKISFTFTAPVNTVGISCLFTDIAPGVFWAPGDTLDVDAVVLCEGSDSTYFDGDTADFTNGNYVWTGTPHASTSRLHAPEPVLAENLIQISSFETGISGWVATGAVISWDSTEFHTGSKSLKVVTAGGTTGEGAYSPPIALPTLVAKNSYLSGSVWVKAPVGINLYTMVATTDGGSINQSTLHIGTGKWEKIKVVGSLVGDGVNPYILVRTAVSPAATTFYVDNAIVVVGNDILVSHFDGDSPGAYWTGVAHASTSRLIDVQSRELMYLESEFYKRRSGLPAGSSFGYHERAYLIANYVDVGMGPDPNKLTNNDLQVSRYRNGSDLVPKEKFSYADHEKRMYELALGL